jgi:hypothetical protein
LLLFLIGGISEISYIAVFGASHYVKELQNLYDLFALNNPDLESDFVNTPLYQRLIIFNHIGMVSQSIKLKRRYNINAVSLP